jgi:cell wall-associated NlpC family hydrolase
VIIVVVFFVIAGGTQDSVAESSVRSEQAAALDQANLRLAANVIEAQALQGGALAHHIASKSPAVVILKSDEALINKARSSDPRRVPLDTRSFMGPVPYYLAHPLRHRPPHLAITATRTMRRFRHSVPVGGSPGIGWRTRFRDATPARFQKPDGVYVDPRLPTVRDPTIGEVALRSAMKHLGQPYVWGGAGPTTFDCSGLVMRAYARAGIRLTHFSGDQWNEGRLIPARDAIPGDLILFGHPIFHVALYLGAGWMLNAPFTGHYVDVLPVRNMVAGVVRP